MLHKKDYGLIAEAIRTTLEEGKRSGEDVSLLYFLVAYLSGGLSRDNIRFDDETFKTECGIEGL